MNADRARARVECVLRAARRIQDPADELGREARKRLPEATGLSVESIELALKDHFETYPTDAEMDALLESTGRADVCHVILSANVFTASLRALVLAVATAPRVYVRRSRRDSVVAELLICCLALDGLFADLDGNVLFVDEVNPEPGHELHIYGSDETISTILANLPEGVLVRAHGTGLGLAIVGANDDVGVVAEALARDIGIFDQRGCLSPRFVFVEGDEAWARQFCEKLDEVLTRFALRVPRGELDEGLRAEVARYQATEEAIGTYWHGFAHGIGFDPEPRALMLPPAARIVHVVAVDEARARLLIEPWKRYVTAVGANGESGLAGMMKKWLPQARWSRLGNMQRPLLDGPVDGRTGVVRVGTVEK